MLCCFIASTCWLCFGLSQQHVNTEKSHISIISWFLGQGLSSLWISAKLVGNNFEMLTKQAEGGRPTKKTKQNPLFGMIPLIDLNPSCSSSPGHRVALWCSCDVLLSLSLSLSPACLRTKMVDRQRKSCTFFAFERQRWNSNCYMTRPPCEEITQYQREINCRVFGVFFKRTCNTHPWISNEILGSRLRPGIIYSKVCIVKWFPLIKCTLTKRLRHFFFHIISAIAIPQLFFFWLYDDGHWMMIVIQKGIGRHIWHLQYAWPNTDAVPCLQFPVASLIPHRQTLRDRELGGPACLPATPVSPLACLLTFWYFSLHPVRVCVFCPCVCVFFCQ